MKAVAHALSPSKPVSAAKKARVEAQTLDMDQGEGTPVTMEGMSKLLETTLEARFTPLSRAFGCFGEELAAFKGHVDQEFGSLNNKSKNPPPEQTLSLFDGLIKQVGSGRSERDSE